MTTWKKTRKMAARHLTRNRNEARRGREGFDLDGQSGPRVEQLIKAAGAELRYLPPYSCDCGVSERQRRKARVMRPRRNEMAELVVD